MEDKPIIEPIGISARHGTLHIDGYPTAKRICKVPGKTAQRMASLRLHQSDLEFCSDIMQQLRQLGEPNGQETIEHIKLRENLLISAIVKFCGCFGKSAARFQLPAEKIYKNFPHALEAFNYTKDLRDKHIVHDENNCHYSITCAVLDEQNLLIDILSLKSQFFPTFDFYQNLFELITHARKHIESEIEKVLAQLFIEVNALKPEERSKLKDVEHKFPLPSDIAKNRDKNI